jgi:uncharacterized membrane protein
MASFEEPDAHEPLDRRLARHAYDRLIMLSDGVFAIAATLLALEVKVPPGWDGTIDRLITTETVTAVISYVVSFAVVGIYWMGNRRVLAMFVRLDGFASFLAIAVLMLVALLPPISSTLMLGGRFTDSTLIYVGYVTLIGWVQAALWGYGAFVAKLTHPGVDGAFKVRALVWMLVMPTAASGLALWSAHVSANLGYLGAATVMALMFLARRYVLRHPNP